LWDTNGKPIGQPFKGHEEIVNSVAFSPDGKTIVSGSSDKTVRLWDTNGKPIGQPFKGHESSVLSVAFSPDGKTIVSGSLDKTVRLWTLAWPVWLQLGCNRLRLHPDFISPAREDASQEEVNILQGAVETCLELGGWNNQQKTEFLMQQKAKFREQKAELLVQQGLELAQKKADLEAARAKFAEAKKLDASIVDYSKLETEMKSFASQWIEKGITQAKEGDITSALTLYEKAQQINPAIVNADSWNGLCWFGSIDGSAKDVLFACEKAVKLASAEAKTDYQDSRGLAKALTGDTQGAISDFQSYVDDPQRDKALQPKRKQWIEALKKGRNPFTKEVLEKLKNED
jgi:WD40 repeat protein